MVEVMKTMVTSLKRSHACTATLSAPYPAAGHHRPTPLPETPGHSWASLEQAPVGSLLLFPGSWCTQGSVCALCEPVSQPCVSSGTLWWVNGDLLQEGLCHTQVCCTLTPTPTAVHCWPIPPQETLKDNSVSVSVGSLGPGVHKVCLSLLSISGGYRVWF